MHWTKILFYLFYFFLFFFYFNLCIVHSLNNKAILYAVEYSEFVQCEDENYSVSMRNTRNPAFGIQSIGIPTRMHAISSGLPLRMCD